MEGRPCAGRRVCGGGEETVSILRTAGSALLRSLQLYKPLVSLASISSPENWHHWELPLAGPRPGSPPPPGPLHPSHRVSVLLTCVPGPAQTLPRDTCVNE